MPELSFAVTRLDSQVVVLVRGDLEASSAPMLRRCLLDLIVDQGNRNVAVDLADVSFMDAAGVTLLVQARKALNGSSLSVIEPSPSARRVLELCGVLGIFPMFERVRT